MHAVLPLIVIGACCGAPLLFLVGYGLSKKWRGWDKGDG